MVFVCVYCSVLLYVWLNVTFIQSAWLSYLIISEFQLQMRSILCCFFSSDFLCVHHTNVCFLFLQLILCGSFFPPFHLHRFINMMTAANLHHLVSFSVTQFISLKIGRFNLCLQLYFFKAIYMGIFYLIRFEWNTIKWSLFLLSIENLIPFHRLS